MIALAAAIGAVTLGGGMTIGACSALPAVGETMPIATDDFIATGARRKRLMLKSKMARPKRQISNASLTL
jgi:hypothetical protein